MSAGPRLQRRSTLALAAAGLVAVAGCDDGETPTPAPTAAADPDVTLVDRVLTRLRRAHRLATAADDPDLADLHRAHIEALDGTPPTGVPRRAVAPDRLRRHEQELRAHLVDAALAAESGALARLLASMSAAVSQRLSGRPA